MVRGSSGVHTRHVTENMGMSWYETNNILSCTRPTAVAIRNSDILKCPSSVTLFSRMSFSDSLSWVVRGVWCVYCEVSFCAVESAVSPRTFNFVQAFSKFGLNGPAFKTPWYSSPGLSSQRNLLVSQIYIGSCITKFWFGVISDTPASAQPSLFSVVQPTRGWRGVFLGQRSPAYCMVSCVLCLIVPVDTHISVIS